MWPERKKIAPAVLLFAGRQEFRDPRTRNFYSFSRELNERRRGKKIL